MKILIADKLSDTAVKALEDMGEKVTFEPGLKAEDLPEALGDHTVLVVRSTKVTAAAIEAAPGLSLIIRAGAGVNTIDLKSASDHGVHVANCPGKNTDAVAELALGLMVAADRRIAFAAADLRDGKWRKKEYGKARGLKGRTLGIIGVGSIGRALARCAQGLGMNVIGWSRSLTPEKAEELGIEFAADPRAVAEAADAVSVHLAAKPETKHFINAEFFGAMKDGAVFVNTSRGQVVDTEALKKAIADKSLRVGLDVYEGEPAAGDPAFADVELAGMVTGTPHIGASTDQASEAIAGEVVRIVQAYEQTGKPTHAVNIRAKTSAIINLVVRHYNKVGVIAHVVSELRGADINIEEVDNTIFEGGQAACCTLKLDDKPTDELIERISSNENIIRVMLK
jgi:D-3-phosphoglycerate dehydrogenase